MKEKVGVVDSGGLDVERAIKNGSPWKRVEGGVSTGRPVRARASLLLTRKAD